MNMMVSLAGNVGYLSTSNVFGGKWVPMVCEFEVWVLWVFKNDIVAPLLELLLWWDCGGGRRERRDRGGKRR